MTLPDTTEVEPGYNEAGFLETMRAKIRGAGTWTDFVTDINYNEKSQRTKIFYANGSIMADVGINPYRKNNIKLVFVYYFSSCLFVN